MDMVDPKNYTDDSDGGSVEQFFGNIYGSISSVASIVSMFIVVGSIMSLLEPVYIFVTPFLSGLVYTFFFNFKLWSTKLIEDYGGN